MIVINNFYSFSESSTPCHSTAEMDKSNTSSDISSHIAIKNRSKFTKLGLNSISLNLCYMALKLLYRKAKDCEKGKFQI